MGKISLRNKAIIGILTLSSLSSLSRNFVKNLYLKNNSELTLKHKVKELPTIKASSGIGSPNEKEVTYKASDNLSIGALVGKNKDLFIYLGGEINKENQKLNSISNYPNGKVNVGLGFKRKINEHIEVTFNGGYQYMGGMEENVKEGLKLRGLWDKKYDNDEKARKEFYHSQGLRLKDDEVFAAVILDLNYEFTKSKLGIIYSTEDLYAGKARIESFVELNQKIGKLNVGVNLNHKLKSDFELVDRLGRLKADLILSSKLGNLELKGKVYTNIGSLIRSYKNRMVGGEASLYYTGNSFSFKSKLNHETVYDYSKNKKERNTSGEYVNNIPIHGKEPTEKLLYKQELLVDLGYKNNTLKFNSENKLKGNVFTNTNGTIKIDQDKYKNGKDSNKDHTVFSIYTKNEVENKLGPLNLRIESKYRYNMELNDSTLKHNHLALGGFGLTYESSTNKVDSKNNVDLRYLNSYEGSEYHSTIIAWSDNKIDYRVNDRIKLTGELNLTSSNKFDLSLKKRLEILGLMDTKGIVESRIGNKVELKNEIGLNALVLFDYEKDNHDNNSMMVSTESQPTMNLRLTKDKVLENLLLDTTHHYKIYTKNRISYKVKEGIKVISNLGITFTSAYSSDKLYSVLKDIKRKQIDEDGIVGISEEDKKKVEQEKRDFEANDALERISINPGLEAEFKFLNDGLVIKPKAEVSINFDNEKPTYKYKSISAKATLNVDYRW
ncbi:hypothetical protein [Streptobacillus notomytis]|uniref:hypothetical protein n=1 Tax=Streptobacillus notomytis TaxID=1712031 RepID=UPI0009FAF635|nr:hypothetical protein [Streptobacillus notomytis]